MPKFSYAFLLIFASVLPAGAVSLPAGGFFTDFSSKPGSGDFSTRTVTGAAADIQSVTALDDRIQLITAASINSVLADAANPPAAAGTGLYSAVDEQILTRPTGVQTSLIMATVTNDTGSDLDGITLSYDLGRAGSVGGEQIDGQRLYWSETGAVNEWTALGTFSAGGPVNVPVTFSFSAGETLFLLWADDNGPLSPDDIFSIDNVSVTPRFASVPEPSAAVLSALCTGVMLTFRRQRRKA